jgi:hypothetical protein
MSLASIREISRHSGDLVLPLLNSISIAKCEVLSTHQGLLDLTGLRKISDQAALELSKHSGFLRLDFEKLPEKAAEIIKANHANLLTSQ